MTQLMIICILVTIVSVPTMAYVTNWAIKITAGITIIAALLILATPILLVNIGFWIPTMIYLLQILQITLVGASISICIHWYNRADFNRNLWY